MSVVESLNVREIVTASRGLFQHKQSVNVKSNQKSWKKNACWHGVMSLISDTHIVPIICILPCGRITQVTGCHSLSRPTECIIGLCNARGFVEHFE